MPRPPRGGSWAAEYARRVGGRNAQIPRQVARGHGPIPAKIARGVEDQIRGKPRALPVATQIRYRSEIGAYEKKYRGGLKTGHELPFVFPSERSARRYLREVVDIEPTSEYVEIEGEGKEWIITLLR